MKKIIYLFVTVLFALGYAACSPMEDNSKELKGNLASLPDNFNVTSNVDSENLASFTFNTLDILNESGVLGVQFTCPEAGINVVIKDVKTTSFATKVYKSGDYVLNVAVINGAGSSEPKTFSFKVNKNLLLENLSREILKEEVKYIFDDDGHYETFLRTELYAEENSIITLSGELASNDVIVNLDFFERIDISTVKFLGKSGVYKFYYNPVRKNVIVEVPDPDKDHGYYVFMGPGAGYPTTVSSEAIIAAYGGGDGRYHTWWSGSKETIRGYILLRGLGSDIYQGTVCINNGATIKPFSSAGWGDDVYGAENCTFSGESIFNASGDWSPNDNMDKSQYYRIRLNAATKAVEIRRVSAQGELLPISSATEEPTKPEGPIESDNFDLATAKHVDIAGEMFHTILHKLEKDAEYTLKGNLADANMVYNVDFFERTAANKVKFLGESGDYTLYYNPIRKITLIGAESPDYPDYLIALGKGFGYPTKMPETVINSYYNYGYYHVQGYPQFSGSADILQYVLFRKTGDKTYQATVFLNTGDVEFKAFHAKGGGKVTDNWGNGGEYNADKITFSGIPNIFQDDGTNNHNWAVGSGVIVGTAYRITLTITNDEAATANVVIATVNL